MTDNGLDHQHIAKGSMLDAHNTPTSHTRDADKPSGLCLKTLDTKIRSYMMTAYYKRFNGWPAKHVFDNYRTYCKATRVVESFASAQAYIDTL